MRARRSNERGAALLIAVLFLLMLIGLATAAAIHCQTSQLTSRSQLLDKQAFYIAEAGVQRARQALEVGTWALSSTNVESFGAGEYSVAITDNGSCSPGASGCELTLTASAYIPSSSSYQARRQLIEDQVPATVSNTNLSLTATASASSSSSGHAASSSKDDSLSTYWEANTAGSGEWLSMDHGSAVTLDQIVIEEENRINGVNIQYSDDGSSWTTASGLSVVESPSKTWTCDFTATSHRYFRAVFTASGGSHKVSVQEMRDYNTANATVAVDGYGNYNTSW